MNPLCTTIRSQNCEPFVNNTHNYIFGFTFKGNVYAVPTTSEVLPYILTLDKASSKNGGGYSLRFNPATEQKIFLLSKGAELICSKERFDTIVEQTIYNKGEIFEKLVTEYFGQVWKKDTVPFYKDGDITVNGKKIQIKLDSATLMNTKQIKNIKKALDK